MKRNLLRTFMVLLAIAAATIGPARGQNANPDVTLDFTTNSWGIPEGTDGKTADVNSYTSGGYTITLCGSSGNGYYFSLTEPYILLGKQGAYLQLPAFSSAVDSIHVVGTSGASTNVNQNIYVDVNNEWVAVSTQTKGMKNVTQKYVIAENYRAAGNIYFIKVDNGYNTQIKKVLVYFTPASSGGGSGSQTTTTYNVTFGGFSESEMNTTVNVTSLPQTFTAIGNDAFYPWTVISTSGNIFINASVTNGGEGKVSVSVIKSDNDTLSITVTGPFEGTATIHVTGEDDEDSPISRDITVSCVAVGGGSTPEPPAPAVPHTVRFASGNDGWTVQDVTASSSATAPAVLQNVMAGDSLVATYSGTRKVKSVKAVKYVDPMTLPLTIEALNNGTITVQWAKSGMKYSLNGGSKESTTSNTNINVSAGDKVSFYGNGTSITNYFGTNIKGSEGFTCKVYGNIMSLIDEENFATATTLTANNAFGNLFQNNTSLVDASNLMLPATTLAQQCYSGMFYACSSLTAAPALPATTLKSGCYSLMFYGCRALIAAPALPATTLDQYCYSGMFNGCSSLTAAPALPATTLANSCYNQMFYGCSSLTAAPALPATTLAQQCYYSMFQGCTGLTAAPVLPATTLAQQCYSSMFADDYSLTAAPALPATTLANECYYNMFYGCSGLTAAPALPATTLADYCYASMFQNCTGLTAAPALPVTTLKSGCYSGMFYGCTGLTTAPVLPATTLADNCYSYMFQGCSMLSSVTCLATNISAYYCTDNWLTGVAATGTIITPSSTNWSTGASTEWPYGVSGIPDGWTRVNADE